MPHNPAVPPLVINWHLTEACNFDCRYCYAKWEGMGESDLVRSPARRVELLQSLYAYFRPENTEQLLQGRLRWERVRLNLAGGEPLLYRKILPHLLSEAREIGFDTSIITNGSLLTQENVLLLAPRLSWLGVSVDSTRDATNRLIGRTGSAGKLLDPGHLLAIVAAARHVNPSLRIKLNTVVNRHNQHESLTSLLDEIRPERWKVLRVLPVVSHEAAISPGQFAAYVARHAAYRDIMVVEDNVEMTESYLMIDPLGRFFQNSPTPEARYRYSDPIAEVGVGTAFGQIHFDATRFIGRYVERLS